MSLRKHAEDYCRPWKDAHYDGDAMHVVSCVVDAMHGFSYAVDAIHGFSCAVDAMHGVSTVHVVFLPQTP